MSRPTRPWEDPDFDSDDDDNDWVEDLDPSEFIFALTQTDDTVTITFCPKTYWNETRTMWDGEMDMGDLLPNSLSEVVEGTYMDDSGRSMDEIRDELLELGFDTSSSF